MPGCVKTGASSLYLQHSSSRVCDANLPLQLPHYESVTQQHSHITPIFCCSYTIEIALHNNSRINPTTPPGECRAQSCSYIARLHLSPSSTPFRQQQRARLGNCQLTNHADKVLRQNVNKKEKNRRAWLYPINAIKYSNTTILFSFPCFV